MRLTPEDTPLPFDPEFDIKPAAAVVTAKRGYDEVYTDTDILEQALNREGEFAYGKRDMVLLDTRNTTPSLMPVSSQTVIPTPGTPVGVEATVQLMQRKRPRAAENGDNWGDSNRAKVFVRAPRMVSTTMGVQTVDVEVPAHSEPSEVMAQITDSLSQSASTGSMLTEMAVQTDLPRTHVEVGTQTAPAGPTWATPVYRVAGTRRRRRLPQGYWYHPSIDPTPGYGGVVMVRAHSRLRRAPVRRRRRRRRTSPTYRPRRSRTLMVPVTTPDNIRVRVPSVRYHPSIVTAPATPRY